MGVGRAQGGLSVCVYAIRLEKPSVVMTGRLRVIEVGSFLSVIDDEDLDEHELTKGPGN